MSRNAAVQICRVLLFFPYKFLPLLTAVALAAALIQVSPFPRTPGFILGSPAFVLVSSLIPGFSFLVPPCLFPGCSPFARYVLLLASPRAFRRSFTLRSISGFMAFFRTSFSRGLSLLSVFTRIFPLIAIYTAPLSTHCRIWQASYKHCHGNSQCTTYACIFPGFKLSFSL